MTVDTATVADNIGATTPVVTPVLGGGELLSMGLSMFIVVAAIVILGWFYSRSRLVSGGNSDLIDVVATRMLGPKERLMIVQVADQQLLIGMTVSGVETLHVLTTPVATAETPKSADGFSARLRLALKEIGK